MVQRLPLPIFTKTWRNKFRMLIKEVLYPATLTRATCLSGTFLITNSPNIWFVKMDLLTQYISNYIHPKLSKIMLMVIHP